MGSRSRHPTEPASGLPITERGGGVAVVRGALRFTDLIQLGIPGSEPVIYVMVGIDSAFELTMRVCGKSPTSSFLLCFLCSDALGLPRGLISIFPAQGNGKRPSVATVRCSRRSESNPRASCFDHQFERFYVGCTKSAWKASTPSGRTARQYRTSEFPNASEAGDGAIFFPGDGSGPARMNAPSAGE